MKRQVELRIPRTIFEPGSVEIIERHEVDIQPGDYIEILVGGLASFEGDLVVLAEPQVAKLVRVRKAPTAAPSKLTRQASDEGKQG